MVLVRNTSVFCCMYSVVINFCFSLGATQLFLISPRGRTFQVNVYRIVSTLFPICFPSILHDVVHINGQEQSCNDTPKLVLSHNFCARSTSSILFCPTAILPMDDRTSFADLFFSRVPPIASVSDWVAVLSTRVSTLLWQ